MTNEIRVSLCPDCDACPEVVVAEDAVTIGEAGNQVRLTHGEWNVLVAAVKSGDLALPEQEEARHAGNSSCC